MAIKHALSGGFFCARCGEKLNKSGNCDSCGFDGLWPDDVPAVGAAGVGWSEKINDPRIKNYRRNTLLYAFVFMFVVAAGIFSYMLATGDIRWDKEGKTVVGVVGAIFFLCALTAIPRGASWEAVVTDKDGRTGVITAETTKKRRVKLRCSPGGPVFGYYNVGDRLRRHSRPVACVEKYDKSRDAILFCPACASMCDARNTYCPRCGCPLLK